MVSAIANHFILKTSVVPAGLMIVLRAIPALKRRAIIIRRFATAKRHFKCRAIFKCSFGTTKRHR
jgi:hypothetical protein